MERLSLLFIFVFGFCAALVPGNPTVAAHPDGGVEEIVTEEVFNKMLLHRKEEPRCDGSFYTYNAFIRAARRFHGFAATGDRDTRKREVAAFLAQTSHQTSGGWDGAPDGRYSWGYCYINEGRRVNPELLDDYCEHSDAFPCVHGQKYYGRGPFHLRSNVNYGAAGKALGYDLLRSPELVETNATVSFETAIWLWMRSRPQRPSCHDVMAGKFRPSPMDLLQGRRAGFGLTTVIIAGEEECGGRHDPRIERDRLGFYERYCRILGVREGPHLSCAKMDPYPFPFIQGSDPARTIATVVGSL